MSTLGCFGFGTAFGVSEIPEDVLYLFKDLVVNPDKKIEFASEIVVSGLQGHINLNKDFNIDAFEYAIKHNTFLNKERKKKKESYIEFDSEDWEDSATHGGIQESQINGKAVQKMADAFEEIIADDSLRYAVETIKSLNNDLIVEENIDFIEVLKQAVDFVPSAVEMVKYICDKYKVISDIAYEILNSGRPIDELFAF